MCVCVCVFDTLLKQPAVIWKQLVVDGSSVLDISDCAYYRYFDLEEFCKSSRPPNPEWIFENDIYIYVYTTLIKHFNKNISHSHRKWPHAITICEETQNRTATEEALVVIRVLKTICVRKCFYFEHDLRMTALLNMSSGVRLQVLSSRLTALTCWALWKMFVFSPKCKRRWIAVLFWQEAHRT